MADWNRDREDLQRQRNRRVGGDYGEDDRFDYGFNSAFDRDDDYERRRDPERGRYDWDRIRDPFGEWSRGR